MFEETLSATTRRALDRIAAAHISVFRSAYLAGGTALALQLGHRFSYDLDFFSSRRFDVHRLAEKFKSLQGFSFEKIAPGTLFGYFPGVKFTLFFYHYPLLLKTKDYKGIKVASISDIAAMKIAAIADRGAKRDFIDLFFILRKREVTLKDCFIFYDRKFGVFYKNRVHILKSLVYFEDAEEDPMPKLLEKISWEKIKEFFIAETKRIAWPSR